MHFAIVTDNQKQRLALEEVVDRLGFFVVATFQVAELKAAILPKKCVWLIDTDAYDSDLQKVIGDSLSAHVVLGFSPAPYKADGDLYERWQKIVSRRLSELLHLSHKEETAPVPLQARAWHYVLYLGASMGGPAAVKLFLDRLNPKLPLAILLAQHYDAQMLSSLPAILTRHNTWRCRIIRTTQSLQAGTCLIAPVEHKIVCDSTGRVMLSKDAWAGDYRPNIGELLKNCSEVFGNQLVGIVFSGMGNDGSQFARQLPANQSQLWAQDPATCQHPSQPAAFIATGVCQLIASPTAMADELNCRIGALSFERKQS